MILDIRELLKVSINHFYGIEYEEFASKVAEVGMWLVEHQMNEMASLEFGQNIINLPLQDSANIRHANALRVDWQEVVPKDKLKYIIGNPPFVGAKYLSKENREDMAMVFAGVPSFGLLDYVSGWYLIAAQYIQETTIEVGFVSTNSITQGEQTGILWNELIHQYGVIINFAHRTFQWSNDAKGKASVHCVIIGFSLFNRKEKFLFEYENVRGEASELKVSTINPYLIEGPNIVILNRSTPLSNKKQLKTGNKPIDGGHYIFSEDEMNEFLDSEPNAKPLFKKFIGAREFINGKPRYILKLNQTPPNILKKLPMVLDRIEKVRKFRLSSKSKPTLKMSDRPLEFHTENYPIEPFLIIPQVSSERRKYIPIGYENPGIVCSDKLRILRDANLYDFGILISIMHMAWMRVVTGRLKSDYQYSILTVYNNYPWPKDPIDKNKQNVEQCAQRILDVRAQYPDSSLADLYDPLTMPPDLVKAHQQLDRAVDLCYRPQAFTSERSRIEYLFELYEQYTAPLLAGESKKKKRKG
jgi:hypothetical protein